MRDDCSVSPDFTSPYVFTYDDHPIHMAGCDCSDVLRHDMESQERTQVHVIHLTADDVEEFTDEDRHIERPVVLLHLRTATTMMQAREALTERKVAHNSGKCILINNR